MLIKKFVSSKKCFIVNDRKYYYDRKDAEKERILGDRIYFTKGLGYYIVKKNESSWF